MKLRDLARGSRNPTSFMPAFHIFRSRLWNRETSRRSRRSYEFVPRLSSALHFLTLLQQTAMVPILRILRRPRRPGSPVTLPIRTDHRDQDFRRCTYHKLASKFSPLIPEQNQRNAYREVLIAGDLSEEDVSQAEADGIFSTTDPDTTKFVYGNDTVNTVYFAQPSLSQFVPGGSGAGAFNPPPPMGLKDSPNNTFLLGGRNTPTDDTGVVLRYALPPAWDRCSSGF